jgi:hypothetical protein
MSEILEATLDLETTFSGALSSVSLRAERVPEVELSGTIESGDVTIVQWESLEW